MHDWQRGVPGQGQGGGKGGGKPPPGLARFVKNAEMASVENRRRNVRRKNRKNRVGSTRRPGGSADSYDRSNVDVWMK